jgi:hypothetical protein
MKDDDSISKQIISAYLDACIINWREKKRLATAEEDQLIAACYVDAYQSVRSSLLGETLPL